jgi:hypothetical protein
MTPAEWLGKLPSKEVLVHEVGHTLAGLALGIQEHGIEFLRVASGDEARSHYSNLRLSSKVQLTRMLAGMYSQARLCPETIEQPLLDRLLNFKLFTIPTDLDENGPLWPVMCKHGFAGDWILFLDLVAKTHVPSQRLRAARAAHRKVASVFAERNFAQRVPRVLQDISIWLNAHDEWLPRAIGGPTYAASRIGSLD